MRSREISSPQAEAHALVEGLNKSVVFLVHLLSFSILVELGNTGVSVRDIKSCVREHWVRTGFLFINCFAVSFHFYPRSRSAAIMHILVMTECSTPNFVEATSNMNLVFRAILQHSFKGC